MVASVTAVGNCETQSCSLSVETQQILGMSNTFLTHMGCKTIERLVPVGFLIPVT